MATSIIPCSDYYQPGDTVNLSGVWPGCTGTSKTVAFTVNTVKKIPPNATITVSGLVLDWIRSQTTRHYEAGDTSMQHASYVRCYIDGDSIAVLYSLTNGVPLEFVFAHIAQGVVTFS